MKGRARRQRFDEALRSTEKQLEMLGAPAGTRAAGLPGWSLHIHCCVFLHAKTWGRENRRWALFHSKNWSTWVGTGKEVRVGINSNGTKKDDKKDWKCEQYFLKNKWKLEKFPKLGSYLNWLLLKHCINLELFFSCFSSLWRLFGRQGWR